MQFSHHKGEFLSSWDHLCSNKFPSKLWRIVNCCTSGAICWSVDGKSILFRQGQFQSEYLDKPNNFFKTKNILSFVRQLNLYGFKKVKWTRYSSARPQQEEQNFIHEFQHENFTRDRPELLKLLSRNVSVRYNNSKSDGFRPRLDEIKRYDAKTRRLMLNYVDDDRNVSNCPEILSTATCPSSEGNPCLTPSLLWPMHVSWDGCVGKYVLYAGSPGGIRPTNLNVAKSVQGVDLYGSSLGFQEIKLPVKGSGNTFRDFCLVPIVAKANRCRDELEHEASVRELEYNMLTAADMANVECTLGAEIIKQCSKVQGEHDY